MRTMSWPTESSWRRWEGKCLLHKKQARLTYTFRYTGHYNHTSHKIWIYIPHEHKLTFVIYVLFIIKLSNLQIRIFLSKFNRVGWGGGFTDLNWRLIKSLMKPIMGQFSAGDTILEFHNGSLIKKLTINPTWYEGLIKNIEQRQACFIENMYKLLSA